MSDTPEPTDSVQQIEVLYERRKTERAWSLYLAVRDDLCWCSRAESWEDLPADAKSKVLAYLGSVAP